MSLKLARKIAQIDKRTLAKRAGCDPSLITRWESVDPRQRRIIRRSEFLIVVRLAAALNLTADELLTIVEAPPVRFPKYHEQSTPSSR